MQSLEEKAYQVGEIADKLWEEGKDDYIVFFYDKGYSDLITSSGSKQEVGLQLLKLAHALLNNVEVSIEELPDFQKKEKTQ